MYGEKAFSSVKVATHSGASDFDDVMAVQLAAMSIKWLQRVT